MHKKLLIGLVLLSVLTLLFAACGIREPTTNTGPSVKMSSVNFEVSSITIKKGDTLTIVDDVAVPHTIKNGTWANSTQKLSAESGAPTVDLSFQGTQGESQATSTFNQAGTFKLLCTIHTGMNLTVVVQ